MMVGNVYEEVYAWVFRLVFPRGHEAKLSPRESRQPDLNFSHYRICGISSENYTSWI